jgi:RNA polymerase sigma factor (sigma-70 family)
MSETTTQMPSGDDYNQWVQAIMNRSKEAWDDLIAAFGIRLKRDIRISAKKQGLSAEWAEDVEQEAWLRALRGITNFNWENEEKFYHWLRIISLMVIYEFNRSNKHTPPLENTTEEDADAELDRLYAKYGINLSSIEDQVILSERMANIEHALNTLKDENREIFLRWALGEKPRMLAVIYNKQPNTISQLVQRTIKRIKDHLRNNPSENDED